MWMRVVAFVVHRSPSSTSLSTSINGMASRPTSSTSSAALEEAERQAALMVNDSRVEEGWAFTAIKHADTYFRLIQALPDPSRLRLTKYVHPCMSTASTTRTPTAARTICEFVQHRITAH
jgi:hypothetical protein